VGGGRGHRNQLNVCWEASGKKSGKKILTGQKVDPIDYGIKEGRLWGEGGTYKKQKRQGALLGERFLGKNAVHVDFQE